MDDLFRKTPSLSRADEICTDWPFLPIYYVCVTSLITNRRSFFIHIFVLQNIALSFIISLDILHLAHNYLFVSRLHNIQQCKITINATKAKRKQSKTIYDNKLAFIQPFFTPYATISVARAGPELAFDFLIGICIFRFPLLLAVNFPMLGTISVIVVLNQFSMSTRQSQQSFSVKEASALDDGRGVSVIFVFRGGLRPFECKSLRRR